MALSNQLIQQFQALHEAKYGSQISLEDAELELLELADIVRIMVVEPKVDGNLINGAYDGNYNPNPIAA